MYTDAATYDMFASNADNLTVDEWIDVKLSQINVSLLIKVIG